MDLNFITRAIDGFSETLGRIVAWFSVLVVLLTASIVIMRYGFNLGSIALQETVLYLHSAVFLLGAGYTLKHNEHVRVDVLYSHFSAEKKHWVNLLGGLFLLMPLYIFILIVSWGFVLDSWDILESSSDAGGLPLVYILKSLIPLFALSFLFQGVSEMLKALVGILQSRKEEVK
ncbi:TRAP transporter small permease subunit [Catenovulum maritimum]|uniref:TRAP transporter small permease protein n=1 Tax=Catenovulum maritimum TaxID=1513271 RepID=A0A0J8JH38_9ALTE|nr:TRAP transporter small permease subunit [Catenovulum maritimum]KMT63706.1 hypothetical protein XM47_18300 [Catenovulum maritimum]